MRFERCYGWEKISDDNGYRSYKRRRFGFLIIGDEDPLRPMGVMCVRKNMNKVDPSSGYFNGSYSWERYQSWSKHLFTKKGICRRCGMTKQRQEIGRASCRERV